jgi:hypothetical protein
LRIFGKDLDRLAFALVRRWSVEASFNQVSVSKGANVRLHPQPTVLAAYIR